MAVRWAIASGDNNNVSTWNDGATLGLPTSADSVFTNGFNVNMVADATYISMNNTARARDIATPAMTANNAPSPYVAAASTGASPWNAFDRNYASSSNFWASTTTPAWLSMDFGASVIIDAYTIFGSNNQTQNPRNWTLEGSANNTTWTTLHTVTLPSAIGVGSSYSSGSIGNTTSYRYYRINITLNGGAGNILITELELYQPGTAALAAGGSFNFNTAGVTVTCTSTSASLSAGATNLITVTATTGTVTLNLGSSVTGLGTTSTQIFNYTGACNFTLTGIRFVGGTGTNAYCINKSSTGTITITGSLTGGSSGNQNTNALFSNNGNSVIVGDIFAGTGGSGLTPAIAQSAGNLTVTGNVFGGNLTGNNGITYTGSNNVTVNGNVFGGYGGTVGASYGINTSGALIVNGNVNGSFWPAIITTNNVTVTGNVIAGNAVGISTTSSNTITVTGDVYASARANGISSTSGVVNLTGNMYNGLGRNAIYCPNVFISNTATTLWRMDTGGGNYKFLYSADSTPNLPATTNVRNGVTFGPALSLTGTMVVPAASNVRTGVAVDNTVGTGELTSADIISGINASSNDLAVRLKNALTDVTAGNLISQYKDS
jgi:hypothetical protein